MSRADTCTKLAERDQAYLMYSVMHEGEAADQSRAEYVKLTEELVKSAPEPVRSYVKAMDAVTPASVPFGTGTSDLNEEGVAELYGFDRGVFCSS